MCTCQVLEGGGSILPTETGFFTRKEQQQQWRLGCQVKIREDMTIQIPDFSASRVLVVGDVMLDRYWHGDTSRISPEAPVPTVCFPRRAATWWTAGRAPTSSTTWRPPVR